MRRTLVSTPVGVEGARPGLTVRGCDTACSQLLVQKHQAPRNLNYSSGTCVRSGLVLGFAFKPDLREEGVSTPRVFALSVWEEPEHLHSRFSPPMAPSLGANLTRPTQPPPGNQVWVRRKSSPASFQRQPWELIGNADAMSLL